MTKNKEKLNQKSQSILIVAAEPSSALYAQRILELYKSQEAQIDFFGVGSSSMEKLGFRRLGRSEDLAVMGFQEVLRKIFLILKTFRRIVTEVKKKKPRVALLLDYPDFNLRLARKMKQLKIPVIYYISPQIWAWRRSRIFSIKKRVDKMLVVLPFEEKIYKDKEIPVEFVGHPLLDELDDKLFDPSYRARRRSQYGFNEKDIVLGLMPGSRSSELDYHLKLQFETAKKLMSKWPQIRTSLLLAPELKKEDFQKRIHSFPSPPFTLIQDDPFHMIHLTDLVLVVSGTATLMVGLMEKPMVIMYKTSPLSAFLIRLLIRKMPGLVSCFGLVNIILGKKVVSEFFQKEAHLNSLSSELESYLLSPKKKEGVVKQLKTLKSHIGSRGVVKRVARVLSSYL